jgi:nucleoside 2-deoxyribosyltransferase
MNDRHSKHQPLRVFISHSSVDQDFAGKMRKLLFHRANAQVFTADDLSAGERWETKLRNELSSADVVVALLSPNSVESSWVLQEIGAAWALKKPIIPVVTTRDVLNKMPLPFEPAKVIELTDVETPENAEKFLGAFEKSMAAAHLA